MSTRAPYYAKLPAKKKRRKAGDKRGKKGGRATKPKRRAAPRVPGLEASPAFASAPPAAEPAPTVEFPVGAGCSK